MRKIKHILILSLLTTMQGIPSFTLNQENGSQSLYHKGSSNYKESYVEVKKHNL